LDYLEQAVRRPTSALLVSEERTLAAEFPSEAQTRRALTTIGHGERIFTLIRRASGDLNPGAVKGSLDLLTARRIVAADIPLFTRPSRETHHRIDDPYLRFWLSSVNPGIPLIERRRGDRVPGTIHANWTTWRGRTVETMIRDALGRLTDGSVPEETNALSGYWTRTNDPEIDIVGADRAPIAKKITAVGSIKWLDNKPFDAHDLARLDTAPATRAALLSTFAIN